MSQSDGTLSKQNLIESVASEIFFCVCGNMDTTGMNVSKIIATPSKVEHEQS